MSATTLPPTSEMPEEHGHPRTNYLNADNSIKGWLLTGDHKRIAILYLISVTLMFFVGSIFAALIPRPPRPCTR